MGKLKAVIGFGVIAVMFYVGWNLIPPYFHDYTFRDDLDEIARRASYMAPKTDDELKDMVIKKAASDSVALREDQITIDRLPDGLGITVRYKVHVDMLVHPMDLDFTTNSLNKRI